VKARSNPTQIFVLIPTCTVSIPLSDQNFVSKLVENINF
jgi:hypothetical protein